MAKGYWIAHVDVKEPERYKDYVTATKAPFKEFGAKPLARGGRFEGVEGNARARNVVLEFETYERALACYNSPEYQAAAKIRQSCSDGEILIVEGA